jgi:hypothetical protein
LPFNFQNQKIDAGTDAFILIVVAIAANLPHPGIL